MKVTTYSLLYLWLLALFMGLIGCEPNNGSDDPDALGAPEPETYQETGDLLALREHGTLRLLAPRFDGADALPRQGLSNRDYQRVAEDFANSLELDAQWVYVDKFTDLIPHLQAGEGDLIVTQLTETRERQQQVAFSRPIHRVDELVVGPKDIPLATLEDLTDIELTVPQGSSFEDSLITYNLSAEEPIRYQTVAADMSNAERIERVADGDFQATVLDSTIAQELLPGFPDLQMGPAINTNRPIGWAVRQQNPQLLQALNQFLVAHFLANTTYQAEARDWNTIKERGRIRMLTLNNPASYFMWRGELIGFDYDLAKDFAKRHGLHLSVVLKDDIDDLFAALKNGEGDFIAASITKTDERDTPEILFSQPYLEVTEQIVSRRDTETLDQVEDLAGTTLGVNPQTVFYQRLKELQQVGIHFELKEYPGMSTEALFQQLVEGVFDYMLADSHLVSMEQAYTNEIKVAMDLGGKAEIVWVMRANQTELADKLNTYIDQQYRGLFYNVTYNKYFVNTRKIRKLRDDRIIGDTLSPYDDMVQQVVSDYDMDWRLVVSQMYQESRFNPKARSFAGAQGLMQVLPRTGRELGYTDLEDPEKGIRAGVAYLDWLAGRFPGDIEFQERLYFQLAAYNAGAGHVRDARRLARQLQLNPDRWFDNVEKAMLLLAQPEYYKNARFGYVRGSEPVNYVREIRARYLAYLTATQ